MFLGFPGVGEMVDSRLTRISRLFLLPMFLVLLAAGCRHSSSSPNLAQPGTPPAVTVQPVDATTITGRSVTFAITASGANTIRYQWAKDGIAILGAIDWSYTIPNPKLQDTGHYAVTLTNAYGTAISSSAALTVAQALTFTAPVGLATDAAGNLYIADTDDHTIWKVSPAHQKTLLAGSSGLPGATDAQGTNARFNSPGAIALDSAGNLVVADTGNHTIRRIAPDGTVTTLAGSSGLPGSVDGLGALARFNAPNGLAVAGSGAMYIADSQNHTIRFMAVDGTVTTYVGSAGSPGLSNGAGALARFNQPTGLALAPNGSLYVSDSGNSCIRVIDPTATVSTLAGKANSHGFTDGSATTALFYQPMGIALDASGTLWVADAHNHAIRRVATDGTVTRIAGSGTFGNADANGAAALFNLPCGIVTTPAGSLFVADTQNHILRNLTPTGDVTTLTTP